MRSSICLSLLRVCLNALTFPPKSLRLQSMLIIEFRYSLRLLLRTTGQAGKTNDHMYLVKMACDCSDIPPAHLIVLEMPCVPLSKSSLRPNYLECQGTFSVVGSYLYWLCLAK
ncbi:hypothetical protein BJV78DRAFT_449202 [Lactifluus subvellereus]|nr:hypothetical protein BJV78DRAFT_449202 [Lactifluus subvellereus]